MGVILDHMKFRATVELGGKTATGIEVPEKVVAALGSGSRPPVTVTVGGHSYRTTIARMGGRFLVPLSAENRTAAGVAAGDDVDVDIEPDTAPREVELPADLTEALTRDEAARATFDGLSTPTAKNGCAGWKRPRRPTPARHVWPRPSRP